jgi:cell division protein FtsI/penicillin-binding protein 2
MRRGEQEGDAPASRRRRGSTPLTPRPRGAGRRRLLVVLAGVAVVATAVIVWRVTHTGAGPERAAGALAAALTDGRLAAASFENATVADAGPSWRRLRVGMAPSRASVTPGRTQRSGSRATVELRWRWRLPLARSWSYTTTAQFVLRDGRWRPLWSPRLLHPALRRDDSLRLTITQAPRAPILDSDGHALVVPRPIVNVGVEPKRVRDLVALARTLHRVLGIDAAALVKAVRSAAPTAFVPVITLRRSDYEPLRRILYPLPGTVFAAGTLPLAPTRAFARTLLGTAGHPTAEIVKASPGRYSVSEIVGLSGLQRAFDSRLGGKPGLEIESVDDHDQPLRTLLRLAPQPGAPLRTTLEVPAQKAADAALAGVDRPAALVAVRVSSGAVIASAIGPDPGGYNIAFQGRYPPGSTFKIVTALALLERGERPTDSVSCPASVTVDGKRFVNAEREVLGTISFAHAFAASCNTAFVGLSARVPGATLSRTARTLGLGVPVTLGAPAFSGAVPVPADPVELAAEAFGQGRVLVSPVAMAGLAAAVARGRWRAPQLVEDGGLPAPAVAPALPAGPVATLRELMRGVVTGGTATVLASQPGMPVYGKTGTAETGVGNPPRTHAWFVGYQGDVAFAVLVADTANGFGGTTAAPIAGRFLAALQP